VSWLALAREGRYREATARAEAEGFEELCEAEDASHLLMLGDAARFAGEVARARQAYLALRRRHAGGPDAAAAAFLLGRLAFDGRSVRAEAVRWFRATLAEAPGGPYAREAAGRLIEALERTRDHDGAREAARRYLEAYPAGPHAALARSLLAP
jgi:TolA-binding protein